MSATKTEEKTWLTAGLGGRILSEGYGATEAWHGSNLRAALADVSPELAFWRPAPARHNIAEIAFHHASWTRTIRERLSGEAVEPFVMAGEDWFELNDAGAIGWPEVQGAVDAQESRLATLVDDLDAGRVQSPLTDPERFNLVLGNACHAIYHAGQIQLIKRLHGV